MSHEEPNQTPGELPSYQQTTQRDHEPHIGFDLGEFPQVANNDEAKVADS